jgi:small subunit ribosomal protein S2
MVVKTRSLSSVRRWIGRLPDPPEQARKNHARIAFSSRASCPGPWPAAGSGPADPGFGRQRGAEAQRQEVPMEADVTAASQPLPEEQDVTLSQMLEAGVHFGHQTTRWNPKMRQYIYGARNGIHIIDLQQTLKKFRQAVNFVREAVAEGGTVLFVGTKKQAQDAIAEEAQRCGMYYVTHRWLGGTLTNFRTVKGSIDRLKSIEKMAEDGTYERLTKKEALKLERERIKLEKNLGGIKELKGPPAVMFVIDPEKERIAVAEANKLRIPLVAVADTNCDPDKIDWIIPGNDDAIRAIKLFSSRVAEACIVGAKLGRERSAARANQEEERARAEAATIRVASGGDGPKVEVVSRRSGAHLPPEAAAAPEESGGEKPQPE